MCVLIQFKVANYRSIKNKVTLSMLASKDPEHDEHLIDVGTKDKYLKSSIIYGANASGKSNVLLAFYTHSRPFLTLPIESFTFVWSEDGTSVCFSFHKFFIFVIASDNILLKFCIIV